MLDSPLDHPNPSATTNEDLRNERRRAARQLGLFTFERNCRSVLVGKRRLKAWRVRGTPEFDEHARIIAQLSEEFSKAMHTLGATWNDCRVTVRPGPT